MVAREILWLLIATSACRSKQNRGSLIEAIRQNKQQTKKSTGGKNTVKTVEPLDPTDTEEYPLHQLTDNSSSKPIELNVDHEDISMELDTGAAVSLISEESSNIPWTVVLLL